MWEGQLKKDSSATSLLDSLKTYADENGIELIYADYKTGETDADHVGNQRVKMLD